MWSRQLCSPETSTNVFKFFWSNKLGLINCKSSQRRPISTLRGIKVEKILEEIQDRDGLQKFTPHIEYLVGNNNSKDNFGAGNILDISDKTQFILQSSHPVRYVIEREFKALDKRNCLELKYLDWVTIFGRSLISNGHLRSSEDISTHEDKLEKVGTASECGMFSADVHQTVINIPADFSPGKLHSEFNMGNKYAVLVGDFFAVKTIFFAEKVKSSPVFLGIIKGVEEYTYSSFKSNSNLLDSDIGYPILPHKNANQDDWINYSSKFMGYFTGGLNAAFILNSQQTNHNITISETESLRQFVVSLALVIKLVVELNEFDLDQQSQHDSTNISSLQSSHSSFLSLPAILYQQKEPDIFKHFRTSGYQFDSSLVHEVRRKIASSAIPESRKILQKFARDAQNSFSSLGKDDYYSSVLNKLLTIAAGD